MRAIVVAMAMVLFLVVPCWADTTFQDGAKNVGQGFKKIGKGTGQAFKEGGKEAGTGFKKMGQSTGRR